MGKNIAAFLIAVVLLCVPLSACGATDAALSSTADKIQNVTVNGGAAIVTLYSADNANVVLDSFTSDG